jgi:hypothetical protein
MVGSGVHSSSFLNTATSREVRSLGVGSADVTDRDGWPEPGTFKVGRRDSEWSSGSGKMLMTRSLSPLSGRLEVGFFTVGAKGCGPAPQAARLVWDLFGCWDPAAGGRRAPL